MHDCSRRKFLHRAGWLAAGAVAVRGASALVGAAAAAERLQNGVGQADPLSRMRAQMGAAPIKRPGLPIAS